MNDDSSRFRYPTGFAFYAMFRMTDFSSDAFDFSSWKTG